MAEVVSGTDVRHRNPVEVAADLGLDPEQERAIRNRARAVLRERLTDAGHGRVDDERGDAPHARPAARSAAGGDGDAGLILWVPVEKLFMSEIGFTPASVGVMAAAYAAVVPLLEVSSGVLGDRWSRNRIMVLACAALLASSVIGGLSRTWRPTSSRRWSSAPTSP